MDLKRKAQIEVATSIEDWFLIRECFVKSFRHYSLYKYIIPEDSKRDEFVRAYLDANYEVTVGSGQGILLMMKVPSGSNLTCKDKSSSKIVGGSLFLVPSSSGSGWAIESDEPYWEAYEKYELARISEDGLERVKRYEAWESKHITQKASNSCVPLCNGLFCAISPEYSAKGLGSAFYKKTICKMAEYWINEMNAKTSCEACQDSGMKDNLLLQSDLQDHKYIFQPCSVSKTGNIKASERKSSSTECLIADSVKGLISNPLAPLIVGITHSDRASHFYESNGFSPLVRLPYYDAAGDTTPFYTHLLILDPFRTGRISEVSTSFQIKDDILKK